MCACQEKTVGLDFRFFSSGNAQTQNIFFDTTKKTEQFYIEKFQQKGPPRKIHFSCFFCLQPALIVLVTEAFLL